MAYGITLDRFAQRFPVLASALSTEELEALLSVLKVQEYEASEAVIMEGTETNSLFFVWDGQLDVLMAAPEGERKVAEVARGSLLGEISLLSPGPATATVRSEQGCTVLHLNRDSLEQLWQQNPHTALVFMREISRLVASRLRSTDATLQRLRAQDDIPDASHLVDAQGKLYQEAE